jgi:hypothetical protein
MNGDGITHLIWYAVTDWASIEKVQRAMGAQLAKVAEDLAKPVAKGAKPGMTLIERQADTLDVAKGRDWVTRDIVLADGPLPPAGTLPVTRFNFIKVKPGKAADYRAAWEKYNKPVYDQLLRNGAVLAYGLAVEEVKTDGTWTHFAWYAAKSMEAFDKVRAAFQADRARRSQEERDAISALFGSLTDADAARGYVTRSIILKVHGQ